METLVINRQTRPEAIFSFMGTDSMIAVKHGSAALLAPSFEVDADLSADTMSIGDICSRHVLSLENFKFDRDEANNYE